MQADDVIKTDRLVLRPWSSDDLDAYFDMYSRWEVMQYLGTSPQILASREEAAGRLLVRSEPDPAGPPYGVWAVCEATDDRPVGTALLKQLPWSATVDPVPDVCDVEIGWHLHPDVWGQGYATEAGQAMIDRCVEAGMAEIFAITYPANVASQRVCRRLGMTYVGYTERYYDITAQLFRMSPTASA